MRKMIMIFAGTMLMAGCTQKTTPSSVDEVEKAKWQAEGWSYVETVGVPVAEAESVSHLNSDTARSMRAFGSDGISQTNKQYSQNERLYLVDTMAAKDGRTYSLVFQKTKTAQPSDAPRQ